MERTGFIGGSDMGAILGVDRFRTPLDVWREKVGEALPFEGNADTQRGTVLEPVAAKEYAERARVALARVNKPLIHPEHPFLMGRVDRRILGRREIGEIKCPRLGAFSKMRREGLDESKIAQMQWYVGLGEFDAGTWIVFCADLWDFLGTAETPGIRVEADPVLYASMVERAVHFWREHVEKRIPPTQAQADEFKLEIERAGGRPAILREDVEFVNAMGLLREAKALSAEAEMLEDQAKERLAELIDRKPGVYVAPGARLSFSMAARTSFDKKSLIASRPIDRTMLGLLCARENGDARDYRAIREKLAAGHLDLDLAQFEKQGAPYSVMKPTFYSGE